MGELSGGNMTSILSSFLVILAVLLVASAQDCPVGANSEVCSGKGSCIHFDGGEALCACASGRTGNDCSEEADDACDFSHVENLSSSNIPLSVSAEFENGNLLVNIVYPLVAERTSTSIAIDSNGSSNTDCTYPGTFWKRVTSSCQDEFVGEMPWDVIRSCGWDLDDSNQDEDRFLAYLVLEHHDEIDPFVGRGGSVKLDRTTNHIVPIEVVFQKDAEATGYSDADVILS